MEKQKDKKKLPPFKKSATTSAAATPEEVFFTLTRAKTHGYLRGQQQDVLREYAAKGIKASDVAFELPTGTGKTAVGLLLAEWMRRAGEKTAFLALNNQLASQVLAEAAKLGIPVADLRGDKYSRSAAEEGRFRTGVATAVSTYSNLFNINPVIKDCGLIVFDDAHGGEQYAVDMWTVTVDAEDYPGQHSALVAALRPALSPAQFAEVTESKDYGVVQLADTTGHPECISGVRAVLDVEKDFAYQWQRLCPKLNACLFLVSRTEVTIRPIIPPTHSHDAFATTGQRVYLSATLGGKSDLQRAYGVGSIEAFRAKSAQWGKRYIFVPGLFNDKDVSFEIAAKIWDALPTRRALLIAPSGRAANLAFQEFSGCCDVQPTRLSADDVKDDLAPFTTNTDTALVLAGRYDGLDLPDDDCRLLLLADSPAATNALERHLTSKWKMGPVIRRKERTRLIQGMGRCTRSATDFAIVIWLGQTLVDIASSKTAVKQMPVELQRELAWGIEQVQGTSEAPETLVEMAIGLIEDLDYRKDANDSIAKVLVTTPDAEDEDEKGIEEVKFAHAMWEGDYSYAYETARALAEHATSPALAGYRGWWWYLASVAARLAGNQVAEIDALWHSSKSGVYTGFAAHLLTERKAAKAKVGTFTIPPNVEPVWDTLNGWGWAGPTFDKQIDFMLQSLSSNEPTKFHQGLEYLGKCLGSAAVRSTAQGAPDVVWPFVNGFCACFEAKTDKKAGGSLFKKDLEEAKLHPEWVRFNLKLEFSEFCVVVVSPTSVIDQAAAPFTEGLFYMNPDAVRKFADAVADALRKLRAKFAGRDYTESKKEFAAEIIAAKLDFDSLKAWLTKAGLKPKVKK